VRHNYLYNTGRTKLAVSFQIRSVDRRAVPVSRHAFCRTDHVIYTSRNIRTVNNFEVFDVLECFEASSVGIFITDALSRNVGSKLPIDTAKKCQKNDYHIYILVTAQNLSGKPLYKQRNACAY